jgi:3-methyladenine DNA glycosylase/8-oxoguanine DNA glycosylase
MPTAATPDARGTVEVDGPYDVALSIPRLGTVSEPTWRHRGEHVELAGRTPEGPVAFRARSTSGTLTVEAWGPGAAWITDRLPHLAAHGDDPRPLRFDHPVLDETNRRHPGLRHAATGLVVDALLGRVLGQRVLAVEAARSWIALCRELGGPAPGPLDLLLPPDPERLAQQPMWWFHQRGIERSRARTLVAVCRHAGRLAEVVDLALPDAYARMRAVPGLGPWTVNGVARVALGDPDAIVVGDYWISHAVCSFLTGRSRGSDEEMLALVERWIGQRGRVERLVGLSGHRVQRFGPGVRTPRIAAM